MKNIKISIIIPVYNAEKYLKICLESIQKQSFEQFECLCIDNDSTDHSANIITHFSNVDERFIYLKELQKGPSAARNCGLRYATGDFIIFVDADDSIGRNYISQYINKAINTGADLVVGGYTCGKNKILNYKNTPGTSLIENLIKGTGGVIWAKIYKKATIQNIHFNENFNMREDLEFNLRVAANINSVAYLNSYDYLYSETKGSLSRRPREDIEIKTLAIQEILRDLKRWDNQYVGEFLKSIILADALYLSLNRKSVQDIMEAELFIENKCYIKCKTIKEKLLYTPLCRGYVTIGNWIYRNYKWRFEKRH